MASNSPLSVACIIPLTIYQVQYSKSFKTTYTSRSNGIAHASLVKHRYFGTKRAASITIAARLTMQGSVAKGRMVLFDKRAEWRYFATRTAAWLLVSTTAVEASMLPSPCRLVIWRRIHGVTHWFCIACFDFTAPQGVSYKTCTC